MANSRARSPSTGSPARSGASFRVLLVFWVRRYPTSRGAARHRVDYHRGVSEGTDARIYRKDYSPPEYLVDTVDLSFQLDPADTRVETTMRLRKNPSSEVAGPSLSLHGAELELLSVYVDGARLEPSRYEAHPEGLRIHDVPDEFELRTEVSIRPERNTKLMGLYTSNGAFCTQCEAEGFRKITYYLDRPDVMAVFTTTLQANKALYPVLLSNGNLTGSGDLDDGRHWACWHDPFKKPSYLFALVAGQLERIEDTFTTSSGRQVSLQIFVEPQNIDQCDHAMTSLKKAMRCLLYTSDAADDLVSV